MTALSFSAVQGGYESDWFQPNNPFQLDLMFPESEQPNPVTIYSANDNNGAKPYAVAAHFELNRTQHINMPVFDVIPDAGVYYKVGSRLEPTSASYMTE